MADEAIARAKELDTYYKETGKLVGPLVSDSGHRNMREMSNTTSSMVFRLVLRSISGLRGASATLDMSHGEQFWAKTINIISDCYLVGFRTLLPKMLCLFSFSRKPGPSSMFEQTSLNLSWYVRRLTSCCFLLKYKRTILAPRLPKQHYWNDCQPLQPKALSRWLIWRRGCFHGIQVCASGNRY